MTPPKNRYDRLSELDEVDADADAPLFNDETWVQAADGSWVRSTDKAARKLGRKSKRKDEPEPAPVPQPRAPEPAPEPAAEPKRRFLRKSDSEPHVPAPDFTPAAEPKRRSSRKSDPEPQTARLPEPDLAAEPKRRSGRKSEPESQTAPMPEPAPPAESKGWFGRKTEPEVAPVAPVEESKGWFGRKSAKRERQAEMERQAELERERQLELERRDELERQFERERLYEREREAERQRQFEREAELERMAELDRERKAELERRAEFERARAAELEREVELERARVAGLERAVELERERQAELERERRLERERSVELEGKYYRDPDLDRSYAYDDNNWQVPQHEETKHVPKHEPKHEPKRRVVATHGQQSLGVRVINVATAVGLVVAALAIGAGVKWLGPDPGRVQRPFTAAGAPGEHVDVRTFTITVQTARAAATVQSGGAAQATQGAWVILRVRLTANTEPTHVGYAALRDRNGRTYVATDRLAQPLLDGKRTFQPGISMEGEVVFEVPKDALEGLTALFAAQPDRLALDAMAEVELPALNIAADQPAATLAPTEVKP